MKIAVYFGDKTVYLVNQTDPEIEKLRHRPDTIWIDEISSHAVHALLHEMENPEIKTGVFWGEDVESLKDKFFQHFTMMVAAGGIVENEEGKFLFIFRRGHWDLPKGKLDEGETTEECAKREIEEETGIAGLKTNKLIGSTFHVYHEKQKQILKETIWYHFKYRGTDELIPQQEEDIDEARWVAQKDVSGLLSQSYASIRELFSRFSN